MSSCYKCNERVKYDYNEIFDITLHKILKTMMINLMTICEQKLFSWTMVVLFEQFLASYGQYPKMIHQHATMSFDQETHLYLIFLRLIMFGPFCNRMTRFLTGPIFFFFALKRERQFRKIA